MSDFTRVYVALGSNLNQPKRQIKSGLKSLSELPRSERLLSAPWYQSKAIGPGNQPDYINTVASLQTTLSPHELLHQLQAIENHHGRQRDIRWGARTLDLDLLLYGSQCHQHPNLIIPHPEMLNRDFVLLPLFDLAPDLILPDGSCLKSRLAQCNTNDLMRY